MTTTKRAQPEPTDDRLTARQAAALAADRRRIAASHAAVNPDEPVYDAASHQRTIAARIADPKQHDENQVSLSGMMLATGRIDHAQWMAEIWPTLPEEAY